MKNMRQRLLKESHLEVREDSEGPKITGYGIVYNQEARLWDDLFEIIRPGAAHDVLQGAPDIRCAFNHSPDHIIGRTKSGTLTVEEDEWGVRYTATPPDTQWCRDLLQSIRRGDVDGSSFTFSVEPQDETVKRQEDNTYLREVRRLAALGEVGPVTWPAYEGTTAQVRSAQDEYDSFTEQLRAQEDSEEIAARQRALGLRRKRLDIEDKTL